MADRGTPPNLKTKTQTKLPRHLCKIFCKFLTARRGRNAAISALGQKRTFRSPIVMSALCQNQTKCSAEIGDRYSRAPKNSPAARYPWPLRYHGRRLCLG